MRDCDLVFVWQESISCVFVGDQPVRASLAITADGSGTHIEVSQLLLPTFKYVSRLVSFSDAWTAAQVILRSPDVVVRTETLSCLVNVIRGIEGNPDRLERLAEDLATNMSEILDNVWRKRTWPSSAELKMILDCQTGERRRRTLDEVSEAIKKGEITDELLIAVAEAAKEIPATKKSRPWQIFGRTQTA